MTKAKKLRVLHEIYATLPSVGCKGLCVEACSTIPVFPIELEQLEAAAGRRLPTIDVGIGTVLLGSEIGTPCPLLVLGRCSTYAQRPLICRAFGAVEGLRCPHGCRSEVLVTNADQGRNFERVADL